MTIQEKIKQIDLKIAWLQTEKLALQSEVDEIDNQIQDLAGLADRLESTVHYNLTDTPMCEEVYGG